SIHAIIGENGAGKSTAMKILFGMIQPDAGRILLGGEEKKWGFSSDAIKCGIGMVHQHFMLAGAYSALENLLLGTEAHPFFQLNNTAAKQKLRHLADKYGFSKINLDKSVESFPVGVQQQLEILKLLYREASILILDEPTAVLTPQETASLFSNLKKLKSEGKTVLIITHKLREVMAVSDEVTVLRGGRTIGSVRTADTSPDKLAVMMVGRRIMPICGTRSELPKKIHGKINGQPVCQVSGVKTGDSNLLDGINLVVNAGEIVGVAGVQGNGQNELVRMLLCPRDFAGLATGMVSVCGLNIFNGFFGMETKAIKKLGVGVIPEDRQSEGLLMDRPAYENFILGMQRNRKFSKKGILSQKQIINSSLQALKNFDIRPQRTDLNAKDFSGGNQQKLIIAREFEMKPRFLIAVQPTRGVDIGAVEAIHRQILAARDGGTGVLLISYDLDEIIELSDRILVMYEGRIISEFMRGEATEKNLGLCMGGAKA
ncbi:MAG: ABC transporter ATP-binding protein, partial [Bdellovibrionota bacterium]